MLTNPLDIFLDATYFKRYGKIMGIVTISTLIQLGEHICSPEFQRFKSQCKIKSIEQYEDNYYKKHKKFDFPGCVHIVYNLSDTNYYIIDGQHRFDAAKNLFNKTHINIELCVELCIITKPSEMELIWDTLNHNTRLPEFAYPYIKPIAEDALTFLVEKYPDLFVCSVNAQKIKRPRMSQTIVLEELGKIVNELKLKNWETLKTVVLEYNNWLMTIQDVNAYFNNINGEQYHMETRLMYKTAKKSGLFLGLFKLKSYGYDWTRGIIDAVKENRKKIKNLPFTTLITAKKTVNLTPHEKQIINSHKKSHKNNSNNLTNTTPLKCMAIITECPTICKNNIM